MASPIPLLALLALFGISIAQSNAANGSVFVYTGKEQEFGPPHHQQTSDPSVTFALNADSSTGDLYFHLESPKDNQWFGVGIGSEMKNALFLIAYASDNGTGVTISGRTASAHSEPSAIKGITIDKLYDNGLENANTVTGGGSNSGSDGNIVVDAVCRKCANYGNGVTSLDFKSTDQPFIFAVGPPMGLQSDDLNAGLQEHILYGHFTMDMTTASSDSSASVPQSPYTMSSSTKLGNVSQDHDPGSRIHGGVMCFVFLLFIVGGLLVRVWNVRAHIVVQTIGLILFCMAFAGGIVASGKYNKSKHVNSAHQIIGILVFIALLSQVTLGWMNHRTFKKLGHGTIMGKIHLFLGPISIGLGIVNGILGFRFAEMEGIAIPFGVAVVVVAALCFGIRICINRRRSREYNLRAANQAEQQQPYFPPGDHPPAYSAGAHLAPREYLSRNQSEQSVQSFEMREGVSQPQQPRPMI